MAGLAIVAGMSRTERLTERAISFAIAEADEELAVARLAFLGQGDHAALDAVIDACLARTERTLYARWRAISFSSSESATRTSRPRSIRPLPAPAAPMAARVGPRGAPGAGGGRTSRASTSALPAVFAASCEDLLYELKGAPSARRVCDGQAVSSEGRTRTTKGM
jgi:hypothetical protein